MPGTERASEASIYLLATIEPKPGAEADVRRILGRIREGSIQEPGCLYMDLTVAQEPDGRFYVFERFASRAAWDQHMTQSHVTENVAEIEEFLLKPIELQIFVAESGSETAGDAP